MGPLSPHIAGHIAPHGSRVLQDQKDLGKQPDYPIEDLNVNLLFGECS